MFDAQSAEHTLGSTLILDIAQSMYISIAQYVSLVLYTYINGLAQKEGPTTFACKSENADRQDWYIFYLICLLTKNNTF